ncbi:hypothetical protein [Marinithermus hydrothermalis]|uniref:Uncharacterized protein n=1 Tax=Marinithermus hydrothermalis (strain DSM 14884 / JCM 11576 / T1) TaxID=869210 RepID=F2NMX0_MARHT|nr:hypothetical protein [Marinithermus hydrothermalis]AEB12709.1 hypothetical protein Marky_1979 [Marinithermus hydrothermalis DSM 14884]
MNRTPFKVYRLSGFWAYLLLALAGLVGLFLTVWLLATALAVSALLLVAGGLVYAWRRFVMRRRMLPPR